MPKPYTVYAGNRGTKMEEKKSTTVQFSTLSEAKAAIAEGKAPSPWESLEEFYMDAFSHKVVKIQSELRMKNGETETKTKKNPFLD